MSDRPRTRRRPRPRKRGSSQSLRITGNRFFPATASGSTNDQIEDEDDDEYEDDYERLTAFLSAQSFLKIGLQHPGVIMFGVTGTI